MALAVVLRTGRGGDGGGEDRRSAAAPGGRRPAEVPAGGAGLRRAGVPAGEEPSRPRRAQPVKSGPGPLSLMAKRAGRGLGRLRKKRKTGKDKERRNGRMRWFGKRRGKGRWEPPGVTSTGPRRWRRGGGNPARASWRSRPSPFWRRRSRPSPRRPWPTTTSPGGMRSTSRSTEPVEGRQDIRRRAVTVTGERAAVTLRRRNRPGHPGAGIRRSCRARWLRFWGSASLAEGERVDYSLPLHGPAPSFTVSWEDTLGQAGSAHGRARADPVPPARSRGRALRPAHDLPRLDAGERSPASSSPSAPPVVQEPVELQTVAGHESVTQTALMDAQVTAVTGTVSAATGASHATVPFVPNGETRFQTRRPRGRGDSRRHRKREPGGEPPHPHPPVDAAHPPPRSGSNTSPRPCTSIGRGTATTTVRR